MNFKINRKRFYEACRKTMRAAAPESTAKIFPEVGGILLEADKQKETLKLYCTDLKVSIMYILKDVDISIGGKVVVPADFFTSLLKAFEVPDCEDVAISVNNGIMAVQCSKAFANFAALNADNFPNVTIDYPDNTICVSGLSLIAKQTSKVAAGTDDNPIFDCVKVNFSPGETTATATDTKRFIKTGGQKLADGDLELLIPKRTLNLICDVINSKDEIFIGTAGRKIIILTSEFVITSIMMNGNEHNIEKLIKNVVPVYSALVDAKEFYEAVDILFTAIGDCDNCINVTLTSKNLHLFVHNENGECDIEVGAKKAVSMNRKVFHYKPIYIYDFLRGCTGEVRVEFTDNGLLKLSSGLTDYIISPRTAPKIKVKKPEIEPKTKKPRKGKNADKTAA